MVAWLQFENPVSAAFCLLPVLAGKRPSGVIQQELDYDLPLDFPLLLVQLALRIPLDFPAVDADPSRLQRVFVNLVSNALKHTRNGTIVIKAEEEDGWAKVTVKDTGSGISAEDMPHIWERYYKGKHSETGTGLGLFICKFIVESHGGKIWAESEPGKGTAFMFNLPLSDKKSG